MAALGGSIFFMMGMTVTEKILARHAGLDRVVPGQIINANVDLVLANELSAAVAIKEFQKIAGAERVFDRERIALVADHFVPAKDPRSAEVSALMMKWAREQRIAHVFDVGKGGIEHVVLPEEGLIAPGELIVGGDSHTCTYGALGAFATGMGSTDVAAAFVLGEVWLKVPTSVKVVYTGVLQPFVYAKDLMLHTIRALGGIDGATYQAIEFTGETIERMSITGRLTMANMAVEAGAKNGIMAPDEKAFAYVRERTNRPFEAVYSDPDARYERVLEIDAGALVPTVAKPHSPENTVPVTECVGTKVDQVFIGSCTNGRIEDLREVAHILEGRRIAESVRVIVNPGSQKVYIQAAAEGILGALASAGCVVNTPGCGACFGG
ncbi:MAG: 3-isopropylmalate dehydratase large subunit, partial [bacterium]|nr:3-isopropylmalate dehydratase large subunit [bacterium]